MKKVLLFVLISLFGFNAFAQSPIYSKINITLPAEGLRAVAKLGLETDHGAFIDKYHYTTTANALELAKLTAAGISYEVLVPNMKAFLKDRNSKINLNKKAEDPKGCRQVTAIKKPADFELGSYAGYYTYAEVMEELDKIAAKYPTLVKARAKIDPSQTTLDGNSLYWLRLSDNANTDEAEPEVLYTAVHHAREPGSVMALVYYMYYLLENYTTNPEIKAIVDNTELYFIPFINPDGYQYNELNDPEGYGFWRKNTRKINDTIFGVDPNRNYGGNWGRDDFGSSPNREDQTYRGESAFSEVETQQAKKFAEAHNFKFCMNVHTFSNVVIYPDSYENTGSNDSLLFPAFGKEITKDNSYNFGTCFETLSYTTNGDADDWYYKPAGTKSKVYAFTPELGGLDDNFWAPIDRIESICAENVTAFLALAKFANAYAVAEDNQEYYISKNSGKLPFTLKNIGLINGSFDIAVKSITPGNVFNLNYTKTYTLASNGVEITDSIPYTTNNILEGQTIMYEMSINYGNFTVKDTFYHRFGTPITVFSSGCNDLNNFETNEDIAWKTYENQPFEGTKYIGYDNSYYPDGIKPLPVIYANTTIDLRNASSARLYAQLRYGLGRFESAAAVVSTDGGGSWENLCSPITKAGSSAQFGSEVPIYIGYKREWTKEEISLDDYLGQIILVGFSVKQNNFTEFFGVDAVEVKKLNKPIVSINSLEEQVFVNIFPQPATSLLNYSQSENTLQPQIITLYNALGQSVQRTVLTAGTSQSIIDLNTLAIGIYTLSTSVNGTSVKKKIIVTR